MRFCVCVYVEKRARAITNDTGARKRFGRAADQTKFGRTSALYAIGTSQIRYPVSGHGRNTRVRIETDDKLRRDNIRRRFHRTSAGRAGSVYRPRGRDASYGGVTENAAKNNSAPFRPTNTAARSIFLVSGTDRSSAPKHSRAFVRIFARPNRTSARTFQENARLFR